MLYPYQSRDLDLIFTKVQAAPAGYRLLYQLPTGGGKTRIFAEATRRFLECCGQKVLILTHRIELCRQTSATLKALGIRNKIISSQVKAIAPQDPYKCYVAMVETVHHRIESGAIDLSDIGLVIIDEAHYNAFQKLYAQFEHARIIGVTATPFSSDTERPMRDVYRELLVGESIGDIIAQGYLAKPANWRYDVELNTLQTGAGGDFTVASSDALYSSPAMLELLLHALAAHARNKKTLIFNQGIFASKTVCHSLSEAGYPVKHLDNETPADERKEILRWFKRTKGAILSSVSILTTGFDEPTVQAVVLNRATTSLTLYHQMIGRAARRLPQKKTFMIIDLGNNTDRFGEWDAPLDWQEVFDRPEAYYQALHTKTEFEAHQLPPELRSHFPNTLQLTFDIQEACQKAIEHGVKVKTVIRDAIRQHARMCLENAEDVNSALELAGLLEKEIVWRVKQYAKCLGKVTKNYTDWLISDYQSRLRTLVTKVMQRRAIQKLSA